MSPLLGQRRPTGRTAVYRLFNGGGDLLYVGSSSNPRVRYYEHASTKSWWPEVASRTEAWFSTRAEAEEQEKAAVVSEAPRYNIQHTALHRKVSAFPGELTADEALLWAAARPKKPRNLGRKPWHLPWAGATTAGTARPEGQASRE